MLEELKQIREDLNKARVNNDSIGLGFAINSLDTFIYRNQEVLNQ